MPVVFLEGIKALWILAKIWCRKSSSTNLFWHCRDKPKTKKAVEKQPFLL